MPSLSGKAFKIALSVSPFPLNFTSKSSSQNRKHYHTDRLECESALHRAAVLQKLRSKRRGRDFLAMRLLTGLLLAVDILLGWSVFNELHLVPPCNLLIHGQSVSKNSAFYLASSFIFLSITICLAARGIREQCRMYPVQMFWERHVK